MRGIVDTSTFLQPANAMEFVDTILEASTEYSIIGQGRGGPAAGQAGRRAGQPGQERVPLTDGHELRTPLNAILGFAQLLEMDELHNDQRDSLSHILSGARHLLALINEVLDIAAIEAGRLGLSLESVTVLDLVLLDLDLPDMSGEDVLRRLRAGSKTADVPVAILSGADASPGLVTRLPEKGVRTFLTKPLDAKALLALLDTIAIEQEQARSQSRSP